jgi:hypothetical protein
VTSNWENFSALRANEWGDFLAGTLGPITFLWLIYSVWIQSHELSASSAALAVQTEELKNSVAHQGDIAKTAAEQLSLQQEEFRDSIKRLELAAEPNFILEYYGFEPPPSPYEDQNIESHKFDLANIGGIATKVQIWVGYGSFNEQTEFLIWKPFETRRYHLELHASDTYGNPIQIFVQYQDAKQLKSIAEWHFIREQTPYGTQFRLSDRY